MAEQDAGTSPTHEEVRFAVVLNGGVSLAVWMGGVVLELDRLTKAADGYKHLLDLVGATARADVISGTSAGGINGAALALAQVNKHANLESLRDLWAEQGRMDLLLRTPFKGEPVSLLKGDEFFLPRLEDAMRGLTVRYDPYEHDAKPIDLRITTTLLHGTTKATTDALGQRLTQNVHQGIFRFHRTDAKNDHFRTEDGGLPPKLAYQLALAARSSASFPVAFEPSYVPVGPESPMHSVASWAKEDGDYSQFAVDGGVLVNTPTREAIEAIDQMPAEGPTRRVMLLVFPHATAVDLGAPAMEPADQPTVLGAVRGIMRAQSSQSNRTFVDQIETYNRGAASRRGGRSALLETLSGDDEQISPRLYELAESLFPHYADIRIRRAARRLAERQVIARGGLPEHKRTNSAWSFDRIREAVEAAHREWFKANKSLPYIPQAHPPAGVEALLKSNERGWPWDISTGERLAASALDMLKRLVWVLPQGEHLTAIHKARGAVHTARAKLRDMRLEMHDAWERQPVVTPDRACWEKRLEVYNKQMTGEIGDQTREQVGVIAKAFGDGARVLLAAKDGMLARDPSLKPWQRLVKLGPDDKDSGQSTDEARWLSRLLALEIATTCLAGDSESPEEQLVELAQISLQTKNSFATYSVTPDDKAGGYSLSRFSGFLKRSWRANDWIWGRIDAASMLCRVMLDPARIRRAADLNGTLTSAEPAELARKTVAGLMQRLFAGTPANDKILACRDKAIEELTVTFATKPGDALPATCAGLAELVAWSLHIEIILEELPELRRAIAADGVDGANARSNGERFCKQYESLIDQIEQMKDGQPVTTETVDTGLKALDAFDRAGVGREQLSEEAASDQMIRTVATAAASLVSVADSVKLGLKAARPVTRSLRGLTLLPYWTILGLTRGGQLARFLGQFGLAAGGLLLVLAILGALPEWAEAPGGAIGGGVLLAAFGYSALRTGSLLHGLVLLSPGVTLVTYGISEVQANAPGAVQTTHGLAGMIGIALFVGALLVLGSVPGTRLSPMASVGEMRRNFPAWLRSMRWVGPLVGVAIIGAGVLIGFSGVLSFLDSNRLLLLIGTAAIVVAAGFLSYFGGRSLRTWQHDHEKKLWVDPPTRDPSAHAAGWAVVYGTGYVGITLALSFVAPATPFAAQWWTSAPWWARAAMATAITFAAVLLLVVPWYAPWRARVAIERKLVEEMMIYRGIDPKDTEAIVAKLCQRLETHGMMCRGLVRRPVVGEDFVLTRPGKRIVSRIKKNLASALPK
jgi:patatin-related protein